MDNEYKNLLSRLKAFADFVPNDMKEALKEKFPELEESEDERIRKFLTKCVKENMFVKSFMADGFDKDEVLAWLEKQGEQKSADLPKSEDYGIDGLYHAIRILENTLGKVDGYQTDDGILEHKCAINAVKELYEQKPTWSEEDEKILNLIIARLHSHLNVEAEEYGKDYHWLKSLRPQNNITDEELAQAKKDAYNDALDKIEYHSGEPTFDDGWSAAIWFLKKRNTAPQNTWKPSKEQMQALSDAGNSFRPFEEGHKVLWSLYNDLKKLREE